MSELRFIHEWEDPRGARGPELRAAWARLEIRVGGQCATKVHDLRQNSVRDGVYLPLYPLAEWLALHWWRLFHEPANESRPTFRTYPSRHAIHFSGEGFTLPDLSFTPTGGHVHLQWTQRTVTTQPLRFLSSGLASLPLEEVQAALAAFIQTVLDRLEEQGVGDSLLKDEWRSILTVSPEERGFCQSAAALGLDPYDIQEPHRDAILDLAARVPGSILEDFFQAFEAETMTAQAEEMLAQIRRLRAHPGRLDALMALRGRYARPEGGEFPWQSGYETAQRLRADLGLFGRPLPSFPDLLQTLGIPRDAADTCLWRMPHGRRAFDALMGVNGQGSPGFVLRQRWETGERFAFCRAVHEYLTGNGEGLALVTAANWEPQQRSRAFAAEFLAPSGTLRLKLGQDPIPQDQVDDLAAEFGVPPYVIAHQIANHALGTLSSQPECRLAG